VATTAKLKILCIIGGGIALWQTGAAEKSARAAERSAQLAENALDSNNDSFDKTWIEMKAQSRAVQRSATASQTAADADQRQAAISDRVARSTENALHLTEAADIELEGIGCSTAPMPLGLETQVSIGWRNRGRTSADTVTTAQYVGFYGRPLMPLAPIPTSSLGPDQPTVGVPIRVGISASPADLDAINAANPGLVLHAWGWVAYKDRFHIHHLIVFSAAYLPRTPCTFAVEKIVSQ
jgi:hypothetical protein